MPESYDREGLIDRATDAINEGNPQKALEIAEEIRKGEGPNADEALIRGIALSSLGRVAEASDAFAEATRRAPNSHKARFNAAVHEFNAGNLAGAKLLAEEAARLDPAHGSTRELVEKVTEAMQPPVIAPPAGAPVGYTPTAPPLDSRSDEDVETLEWVGRLGSTWLTIGWGIAAVAFLSLLAVVVLVGAQLGNMPANTSFSESFQAGQDVAKRLSSHPVISLANLLTFATGIFGIIWTILDINRRRGNVLWIMGIVPCLCLPLTWLILPIYILFGRRS